MESYTKLLASLIDGPNFIYVGEQKDVYFKVLDIDEGETKIVKIRIEPKTQKQGDVILYQSISYKDNDREKALEKCSQLVFQTIFLRGLFTLHHTHSQPFLTGTPLEAKSDKP